MNERQHFDVVISGGGLAGSLMALSLLSITSSNEKPLSIAIVEASIIDKNTSLLEQPDPAQTSPNLATRTFDDRVLALSHASANYLKAIGVWSTIETYAQSINDIHISDRGYYGKARITANNHQVEALGYVIEMSALGLALQQALKTKKQTEQHHKCTWFTPDTIHHIEWQSDVVNISLSSNTQLCARLLIGCDGANSVCRKAANIACNEFNYQQSALITNVSTAKHHKGVAYERFTQSGPIALLPMTKVDNESNRCSLVWTLTPEQADEIKLLTDNEFKQRLEVTFGSWLGSINKVGTRHVYPLSLVKAKQQIHHRMVLIGNASHTIHPIAGQGFNLGLRDVKALAKTVTTALNQHSDIGAFHHLNAYAQSREHDHQTIITLTDSLVTLFSNQISPLVAGRNVALKVLNYVPAIKHAFVTKTMGY